MDPSSALALLSSPSGAAGGGSKLDISSTAASHAAQDTSGSVYSSSNAGSFVVGGKQSNTLIYVIGAVALAALFFLRK